MTALTTQGKVKSSSLAGKTLLTPQGELKTKILLLQMQMNYRTDTADAWIVTFHYYKSGNGIGRQMSLRHDVK